MDGTKHVQREGAGNSTDPVVGVDTVKEDPDGTAEEEESQGVQWRVQLPDSVTSLSNIVNSIVLYLEELTKFLRERDTAVSLEVEAVREPCTVNYYISLQMCYSTPEHVACSAAPTVRT